MHERGEEYLWNKTSKAIEKDAIKCTNGARLKRRKNSGRDERRECEVEGT